MKNIYSLLVGINNYPDPKIRLRGCRNDVNAMSEYLEQHFHSTSIDLHSKILIDSDASRAQITKGFEHFDQAGKGDVCIFYFSGHGSRVKANYAFWPSEPDKMHETLICWDSRELYDHRIEKNGDLYDKEIAYLIWKATHGKGVHFLAILDCCHSGTLTREFGMKVRQIQQKERKAKNIQDFLGFEQYTKIDERTYAPPRGRHIQLAASRAKETAIELSIKGAYRGLFTYCLIEVLKKANNRISYAELANRLSIRIKNVRQSQSAQIFSTHTQDKELIFLNAEDSVSPRAFVIGYDRSQGWILNAGRIHGISSMSKNKRAKLLIIEDQKVVELKEVFSTNSSVRGMDSYDKLKTYAAQFLSPMNQDFLVGIIGKEGTANIELLKSTHAKFFRSEFDLFPADIACDFIIFVQGNKYSFFMGGQSIEPPFLDALFDPIIGDTENAAFTFLLCVQHAIQWRKLLFLNNPKRNLAKAGVRIDLFKGIDPGNYLHDAPSQKIDWRRPGPLVYLKKGEKWHFPAFKLKIKNTGKKTLWVSLLYLAADYSISNQLIQLEELGPGEEAWAEYLIHGKISHYIPVKLVGHTSNLLPQYAINYLKILVCSKPFQTDFFNQKAITWIRKNGPYKSKFEQIKLVQEWTAKEIMLEIVKPSDK